MPFHIRLIRHLRTWHRRLGISAAAFILFLSVSGIALNHSHQLGLDTSPVMLGWLQDIYGIKAPRVARREVLGRRRLDETGGMLWLDGKRLGDLSGTFQGAVRIKRELLILQAGKLLVVSARGAIIDQIGAEFGLPYNASRIGTLHGRAIIRSGGRYFTADSTFTTWSLLGNGLAATARVDTLWGEPRQQPLLRGDALVGRYRGQLLNWQRVLQDVHSGRIWGRIGPWLSDIVAILLILLSGSGIYVWVRRWRQSRLASSS